MGWNLNDLLDQLGVRPSCGVMGVESSCDIQREPQSPACPPECPEPRPLGVSLSPGVCAL